MTVIWFLLTVVGFVVLWWIGGLLYDTLHEWPGALVRIAAVALAAFAINDLTGCSEKMDEHHKAREAQEAADRQPRVIRRVDGCEVYTFKEVGRWHFFTRCPQSKTSTTSTYSVNCGKNCTREESETIEVK